MQRYSTLFSDRRPLRRQEVAYRAKEEPVLHDGMLSVKIYGDHEVYYPSPELLRSGEFDLEDSTVSLAHLQKSRDELVIELWKLQVGEKSAACASASAQGIEEWSNGELEKQLQSLKLEKMNKFHVYNRLKDIADRVFGILAECRNCTVRDLYKQFDA
eukprot:TRINITY_DN10824_c0_g1_i1.p1 TRINITY_DN10824_c0_g1~~TRINITY_DN10824_c0_g1_i1.p1  ORF type:complete len:158 (+),score=23.03 TRINITY_DN10824_c0_g1_i1:1-474(+)